MSSEIISVIANIALALSFIVGLIFGIVQVKASARDRRERLTLETLREFHTREFVTHAWENYKALFLDILKNKPDPFLGEYFQWLAESIKERMQKNPRKPFYETNVSAI